MKQAKTLKETLAGVYGGLYGEVVEADTYRLRSIPFQPDIVFDVGGNIGIFARFARELFPHAKIISMEPDPDNCRMYRRFTPDENTSLVERALGNGNPLFHGLTAANGSGETYLSAGLGYPEEEMWNLADTRNGLESSPVLTLSLAEFLERYYPGHNAKTVLKVDCEGAENTIWMDRDSMDWLRRMDYICMELHDYALTGGSVRDTVISVTNAALLSLDRTHTCVRDGVHFWAIKKEL